jgi:hypothetical protein
MRSVSASAILFMLGVSPALADSAPAFVVPGRPDVPVIINGVDASWGVVEGDWGLYRPGSVAPTVIPSPIVIPSRRGYGYFPSLGRAPGRGRLEIQPPPNRALPQPAESFHRVWSAGSDPVSAGDPPADPPPVILAPPQPRARRHHGTP